jgi:RNA polymerase sigma-70 factor (family 1)
MSEYENLPDSELLAAMRKGGQTAYRALFDRYYIAICRQAALRLNGDQDAAEDVVQQVFIDFWVQEKYKVVDTSVAAYLARMVQFKVVDHIRKNVVRKRHEGNQTAEGAEDMGVERIAALEKALHKEIAELPEQCRSIFTAVYLEGKKYKEAAEAHGVSINTVKEQLKRAMVKLRARLKDSVPIILWLLSFLSPIIHHLNDC